jgi:hypothetical protein
MNGGSGFNSGGALRAKRRELGWRHTTWELVRYYCSLKGQVEKTAWLDELNSAGRMKVGTSKDWPIPREDVAVFIEYLTVRRDQTGLALGLLRTEEEAIGYCKSCKYTVGRVPTKSQDHHQSSNALVSAVTNIAANVCEAKKWTLVRKPQQRCAWCVENGLHVTARNLDGAIPSLANPVVIWEIKEYWGKTSGGSKMSDAVYECNLVGRELREFEERSGHLKVQHVVFLDGREQWLVRQSDLTRFIDLFYQGIIDRLFIGKEVESQWEKMLLEALE